MQLVWFYKRSINKYMLSIFRKFFKMVEVKKKISCFKGISALKREYTRICWKNKEILFIMVLAARSKVPGSFF